MPRAPLLALVILLAACQPNTPVEPDGGTLGSVRPEDPGVASNSAPSSASPRIDPATALPEGYTPDPNDPGLEPEPRPSPQAEPTPAPAPVAAPTDCSAPRFDEQGRRIPDACF